MAGAFSSAFSSAFDADVAPVTGTGTSAVRGPHAAGTGSVGVPAGSGSSTVLGPTVSGAGSVGVSGAGASSVRGPSVSGAGDASPPVGARVTRVSRAVVGTDTDPPGARVTRLSRSVLGVDSDPAAGARLTGARRSVLGAFADPASGARITRLRRSVLGAPREVTFDNGTTIVGLTWIELTRRDGSVLVLSRVPLDDPPFYYHGYKWPFVMSWGRIRRGGSDWQGQFTAADLRVDCTDHTGILRQIADDDDLANLYCVVRSIDDARRRQQATPTTVFRGPIREDSPGSSLRYSLTLKDPLQERFASSADADQLPQRRIVLDDFPNAGQTLVSSSAAGYTVAAAYTTVETDGSPYVIVDGHHEHVTTVLVSGGSGQFANGDRIQFAGGSTIYTVSAGSWADPETAVTFSPALTAAVASGAAITQIPAHRVEPTVGQAVPFWYGRITDQHVEGGVDAGDGQGPAPYVGDRVLPDGHTYGEFLWGGHACYSPSGRPFPMPYFLNEALDNLALAASGSGFYIDGVFQPGLVFGDLATEADAGGRVCLPGYGNWTANGFTTPYRDYNGRRYTVLYLRGILRDWALKIGRGPDYLDWNTGGGDQTTFAVDGYGADAVGDGSGALIENIFDQWLHALRNHILPVGGYQTGPWRTTSPAFPDDATVPMIADASFAAAKALSIRRIGGAGYVGHWGCGPTNETIAVRELFARLAVSSGAEIGWTRKTQFMIDLLDDDVTTAMVGAPTLTDERDIFDPFRPERVERELYSVLPYVHTRDFFTRAAGGWRSITSAAADAAETTDATAVGKFGPIRSPKLELWCLRGKNRASDSDAYTQGSLTIADVLAHKIRRCRTTPSYVTFVTGPRGYSLELFDRIWISHFEQLGGRTLRRYRIEEHHALPDSWTVELKCRDLTHVVS